MEKRVSWKKWEKPGDPHLMNRIQWDETEIDSIQQVFNSDWFGYSDFNKKFEKELCDFTNIAHFKLTNSGSSAITAAVKSLKHEGKFSEGDLVLHPITTFPTSISSAIHLGLTPVFIDTKPNTFVVDEEQVEQALNKYPQIKGMILPYLLGNIPDMERIKEALGDRFLVEDSCDTMGGYFNGKPLGSFGDFMALSFYGSHHISTGGVGGAIGTNHPRFDEVARSKIFWGHDYRPEQKFTTRYDVQTIGNNFQMSAILAAFGLAQIKKLPKFVEERDKHFMEMHSLFSKYDFFNLPESHPKAQPSWFSYPLTLKESAPFSREDFEEYLSKNNVETRPVMCANLLHQEPFKNIKRVTLNNEQFPVADQIEKSGLFIPCWGMPENQKQNYHEILRSFLESYSK